MHKYSLYKHIDGREATLRHTTDHTGEWFSVYIVDPNGLKQIVSDPTESKMLSWLANRGFLEVTTGSVFTHKEGTCPIWGCSECEVKKYDRVSGSLIIEEEACTHQWKQYTGLNEQFEYCEVCDEKK